MLPIAAALAALVVGAGPGTDAGLASTYRVRPGDTLTAIAAAHRLTVRELARLNGLDPNGVLLIGTVLHLPTPRPSGKRYRVRPGDSLSAIADRFDTSVATIAHLNRLDPAAVLLAGRLLVLPAATVPGRSAIRVTIVRWARHYGVRGRLALALAWQESGDQPDVVSPVGAWGVMQVMPATWRYVETVLIGHRVPRTADGGIRVGIAYLSHLLTTFGRNERLAVAAYLQGERSVREHGILRSSDSYVANVIALAE